LRIDPDQKGGIFQMSTKRILSMVLAVSLTMGTAGPFPVNAEETVSQMVTGSNEDLTVQVENSDADSIQITTLSEYRMKEYQKTLDEGYEVIGLYDISLRNKDGKEIEPAGEVKVTLSGSIVSEGISDDRTFVLFHNTAKAEKLQESLEQTVISGTYVEAESEQVINSEVNDSEELTTAPETKTQEKIDSEAEDQGETVLEAGNQGEVDSEAESWEIEVQEQDKSENLESTLPEEILSSETDSQEQEEKEEQTVEPQEAAANETYGPEEETISENEMESKQTTPIGDRSSSLDVISQNEISETSMIPEENQEREILKEIKPASENEISEEVVVSNEVTSEQPVESEEVYTSETVSDLENQEPTDAQEHPGLETEPTKSCDSLEPKEKESLPVELEQIPIQIKNDTIVFTTESFSEYALVLKTSSRKSSGHMLDLETTENQVETRLQKNTYLEMDKYLSEPTGSLNNQNTYDIYLEQALVDTDHPNQLINPAPEKQKIVIVMDQSSSMKPRVEKMNSSLAAFWDRIKEINEIRLENARNGVYSDINPSEDIEDQMKDHMLSLIGIIGYNSSAFIRYQNDEGLLLTDENTDLAYEKSKITLADLSMETRTDYAMQKAEALINNQSDPENVYLVLLTDGKPSIHADGWHRDLVIGDHAYSMSSINANSSLRTARSLKDRGVTIESVLVGLNLSDLLIKANETGKIEDVLENDEFGFLAQFLSLISSDYPKNGIMGTNGRIFDFTYTYEMDERNGFGQHFVNAKGDWLEDILSVPPKIDGISASSTKETGYATSGAIIQDAISAPFEKRAGMDIQVYKVPRIPQNLDENGIPTDIDENNEVANFRWGREYYDEGDTTNSEWIDITNQVSVSVTGNTVKITGFDYEENAVTNYDKDTIKNWSGEDALVYHPGDYGYKLVVVIPINAKITFGGNQIPTNNADNTQFLPSIPTGKLIAWEQNVDLNPERNKYVEKYPTPVVDLIINYDIVSDNVIAYAPQQVKISNLTTDETNNMWYVDANYSDLKTKMENAKAEMDTAQDAYDTYEEEHGNLSNPTDADNKKLEDLEAVLYEKMDIYEEALESLSKALCYIPNGINNQFVEINYELRDPDNQVIATMQVPHGKAYNNDMEWNITGGTDAVIVKSGTYTINATITPVDTTKAPGGLVYTVLDSEAAKQNIGYSSEEYSSTGSSATGSQSAKTITKKPTAYLYQLKIKTSDSQLTPQQALDFNIGGETLIGMSNLHFVEYEWICTDGKTISVEENEPGITGLMEVGEGVTAVSQIPEQAETEELVKDVSGTTVVNAEEGGYVPVSVILSRNIGNLNKGEDKTIQTNKYMTDSDHIWGESSSVIWEHVCDIVENCNDTENGKFNDSQKYNTPEDASGRGQVQYLIHVLANPMPKIEKSTSTPSITKGSDIKWNVSIENNDITENPNKRASVFSIVDILPYKGDGRIDPNTNQEGSSYSGTLMYKSVTVNFKNAQTAFNAYKNGTKAFYYTTDTKVRTASESQILGTAGDGNIHWVEASGAVSDNIITFSVPTDAVAIKMNTILSWEDTLSIDMTVNVTNLAEQNVNDSYHNQAVVLNGNGARTSNVVVTRVTNLYLSGTIWEDLDANGLLSTTEKKLENITVTLYTDYNPKNPNPVDRTIDGVKLIRAYNSDNDKFPQKLTLEDGTYVFDDIPAGTYYIVADYIPTDYNITKKQAGKSDINSAALDSEAEEKFVNDNDKTKNTAWIKKVTVTNSGVPNQNIGLKPIKGNIKVGKTLDEIYYPVAMPEEEKADYRVSFIFKLRNTATGSTYSKAIYLNEDTIYEVNGKPQVYVEFKNIPLGTYELTEVSEPCYSLVTMTSDDHAITFNKNTGKCTIPLTANNYNVEVYVENKMDRTPSAGDENGIDNWVNMRIPVDLEIKYKGKDPISGTNLTKYTFTAKDFEDMIVTYDDGSKISLKAGTLQFNQVTLSPGTVTNDMNSGKNRIGISGYYSEKGKTVTDAYRVAVNLKPIHKFQLNFNANGATFNTRTTTNSVMFGYDENKGTNYITRGEYKDPGNGAMTTLSGFTFAGWNTNYDGSGTQYDNLGALNAIGKNNNISFLTLYANWKTKVTFNANGGKISGGTTTEEKAISGKTSGQITVSRNQKIGTTLTASKANHNFVLWNTKPDGTGTNLQDYGRISGPVTFYAIYYKSYYGYTGTVQVFSTPISGWYSLECYGACGGIYKPNTGLGGKTVGEFYIPAGKKLYVMVGGSSFDNSTGEQLGWKGGWNGGASNTHAIYLYVLSGSGGATDIRLESAGEGSNDWRTGLSTRIIVAGGGAGSDDINHDDLNDQPGGGNGGGWVGGNGTGKTIIQGGTQTSGYSLGAGEPATTECGGSGGAGYYGGYASKKSSGGGGGSSYVSGNSACPVRVPGWTARSSYTVTGGNNSGIRDGFVNIRLVQR